jgi:quinol monooxygenase YgiN
MIIVEQWVDEAALQEHFTTPHFAEVAAALDNLLGSRSR